MALEDYLKDVVNPWGETRLNGSLALFQFSSGFLAASNEWGSYLTLIGLASAGVQSITYLFTFDREQRKDFDKELKSIKEDKSISYMDKDIAREKALFRADNRSWMHLLVGVATLAKGAFLVAGGLALGSYTRYILDSE